MEEDPGKGTEAPSRSSNTTAAGTDKSRPRTMAATRSTSGAVARTKRWTSSSRSRSLLPTTVESLILASFPLILVSGTIFSLIWPETRTWDQEAAPSPTYFARKSNPFNLLFVKRGWGWTTLVFFLFLATHTGPHLGRLTASRLRAAIRWAVLTGWWILVTRWCFGPPIIDRGFRWTGGRCDEAERELAVGEAAAGDRLTAAACRAAGGHWHGGHDISGHVFLLVLGSSFLMQEAGWLLLHSSGRPDDCRPVDYRLADNRLGDGRQLDEWQPDGDGPQLELAARPPATQRPGHRIILGAGARAMVAAVILLELWMLLMTALYFHTWIEKLTGLLTALAGLYAVYIVPRFAALWRWIVGLPGV